MVIIFKVNYLIVNIMLNNLQLCLFFNYINLLINYLQIKMHNMYNYL